MALIRGGLAKKMTPRERKMHRAESITLSARVPLYLKRSLETYIVAHNRENPCSRMSISRVISALLEQFLRDKGALDDR